MSRKIALHALLLVIASVAIAPALQACETCWPANVKDPSGGISSRIRCFASNAGMFEICTVKEDYSGCNTDDTDPSVCPISRDGGGGAGGGGGTGTGGSTCSTRATGACPPDCWDCGGGGLLY